MSTDNPFLVRKGDLVLTENGDPGHTHYGERLVSEKGNEFRVWDARKSKLVAAVLKGLKLSIYPDSEVLYFGAASGTTVSHISDLTPEGCVFAVDLAPLPFRTLVGLAKRRRNVLPILRDGRDVRSLSGFVGGCDVFIQDITSRDQEDIFLSGFTSFVRPGGVGYLVLKARSISSSSSSKEVLKRVEAFLSESVVVERVFGLSPYYRDHFLLVCRSRHSFTAGHRE